jgi:hypothetical protein
MLNTLHGSRIVTSLVKSFVLYTHGIENLHGKTVINQNMIINRINFEEGKELILQKCIKSVLA